MNLERSTTHSLHRTAKGHDAAGSIAQHGRDAADASVGGFLSVLAAVDGAEASGPLETTTELASPPFPVDMAALPAVPHSGQPDSRQLLPDVGWQVDTAALLTHLNRSTPWSAPSSLASTTDQDAQLLSIGAGGSSAKATSVSTSDLPADAIPLGLPMAGAAPRLGAVPTPAESKAALGSDDAVPLKGAGAVADDTKGARWEAAQAMLPPQANEAAKPAVASVGAGQTANESKARQARGGGEALAQVTAVPSAPALASVADDATRKAERVISKTTELHRGAGEAQWGPYAQLSGRTVEASSGAQSSALPTPEMMVAEQVSYWISGKVQNAELRLDVFGREPVDVSISMKGNEAQVEFRTDQPEVRQVLEGALGHLKTLLKDEGLSLAGAFVGSSGQQREGPNPSPRRPGESAARRAQVGVSEAVSSIQSSGARPSAGRSVDLFV